MGAMRSAVLPVLDSLLGPHGVDRYSELVHPMLTVHELRARVTAVHRPTPDSVTLTLHPTRQWRGFRPGQHVRVGVDVDGVRRTRCYSPAGSAHRRDEIELTVKAHDGGTVSRYLHRRAHRGMVVGLSQAQGEFALPEPRPDRIVLISGGSGITPVMSMLRTLAAEGYAGEITFLHYAKDPEHVPYRAELRRIAAARGNVSVVLHHPRRDGHFAPAQLSAVAPRFAEAQTYLCGPEPLTAAVRDCYAGAGAAGSLHTERFTAPVPAAGEPGGEIRFGRSALRAANSGRTLLEQAEAAGLSPEHGCRMGICFSCTQVKESGCVRNALTGDRSTEEGEEIQLCVSVPEGDVTLDL